MSEIIYFLKGRSEIISTSLYYNFDIFIFIKNYIFDGSESEGERKSLGLLNIKKGKEKF